VPAYGQPAHEQLADRSVATQYRWLRERSDEPLESLLAYCRSEVNFGVQVVTSNAGQQLRKVVFFRLYVAVHRLQHC
jgi:hypothetical protein